MLKTFSIGGVHPHENKLSAHQPIVQAEIKSSATPLPSFILSSSSALITLVLPPSTRGLELMTMTQVISLPF